MEHGSNALDIPNDTFSGSMAVALPNAGIDLVLVLNDGPGGGKIPADIAVAKVGSLIFVVWLD